MFGQHPLELWLACASHERKPDSREQQKLYDDLSTLERWFAIPEDVRPKSVPRVWGGVFRGARLTEQDLPLVQQLYRKLLVTNGNGKSHVEPELLALIAFTLDQSTIPFFVELLSIPGKPGESFAHQRRILALSGLAFLVYQTDEPQAMAALIEATKHHLPGVRSEAINCLKQIILGTDIAWIIGLAAADHAEAEPAPRPVRREPTAELMGRLAEIVQNDPAFQPRFMARRLLAELGQPAAPDYPNGAYTFKVTMKYAKTISRTIEVLAEQSLDDLHGGIQEAFEWDDDHLYSFFMNGKDDDDDYRFASPLEEDEPQWTTDGIIGELGLTRKHIFLYLFDYGDRHEFEIQVIDIRPEAQPGEYPRVIAGTGKAPAQYRYEDEDDEEFL